jgi:hypothetical protein
MSIGFETFGLEQRLSGVISPGDGIVVERSVVKELAGRSQLFLISPLSPRF